MKLDTRLSTLRVTIAIVAVMIFHALLVGGHYVPAFASADQNGYLLLARRFAETGDAAQYTSDPFEFVSGNSVQVSPGVYYGKYPSGYPLLCVVAYWLGGQAAMFLVNPILATLTVLGVFFLGRAMFGDLAGIAASILLATNAVFDTQAITASSHAAAICFATWSMYFLWRWSRLGGWGSAILAGGLSAYAVSIRYTEGLLALPVLAMIAWRLWQQEPRARGRVVQEAVAMTAAALVAIAPLLAHQWIAYGSPFSSGYALCKESTGFGWEWFEENWWTMLSRMESGGLALVFPVGLAGLAALAQRQPRMALILGSWLVPGLLIYTAYCWAPKGEGMGYVRFFVSLFPPLIVGALALLQSAVPSPHARTAVVGLFTLLVSTTGLHYTIPQMERCAEAFTASKAAVEAVRRTLPPDAAIFASGEILDCIEFYGSYRLYGQGTFERDTLDKARKVLAGDDPHPFQRERAQQIVDLLGDKDDAQLLEQHRELLADLNRDGRAIALITDDNGYRCWRGRLSDEYGFLPRSVWASSRTDRQGNELVSDQWLYELVPRAASSPRSDVAALKADIELLRERARMLRAEYKERYPLASQEWKAITDLDCEVRRLGEEYRSLRGRTRADTRQLARDP